MCRAHVHTEGKHSNNIYQNIAVVFSSGEMKRVLLVFVDFP